MKWPRHEPDQALLNYFRQAGDCELCYRWFARREPHHIFARGTGSHKRLDLPINLIALGSGPYGGCGCHTWIHSDPSFSPEEKLWRCLETVIRREGIVGYSEGDLIGVLHTFQRLPKETTDDELDDLDLLRWTKHNYGGAEMILIE